MQEELGHFVFFMSIALEKNHRSWQSPGLSDLWPTSGWPTPAGTRLSSSHRVPGGGGGGPAESRSHIVPTRVSLVSRCLSVPRCYSLASMCSCPLLTQVFTSPEIRFTEHGAFQKPGDTSGALQFNGAHYGNQLNAEERDKSDYLPAPSTRDSQPTLMGAHLWPHSVTQPSLSAAVTNL